MPKIRRITLATGLVVLSLTPLVALSSASAEGAGAPYCQYDAADGNQVYVMSTVAKRHTSKAAVFYAKTGKATTKKGHHAKVGRTTLIVVTVKHAKNITQADVAVTLNGHFCETT